MTNYSQANQDLFVLEVFDQKKRGTFLDLGCNDPIKISNTFLLESEFNWTGSCYDIDENLIKKFEGNRNCHFSIKDCTKLQLSDFQKPYYDYLSLDLEPAAITLKCLQNIPFNHVDFGLITYEHDEYRFGSKIKNESRKILIDCGFSLLCSDVHHHHNGVNYNFEDWYINTKYVSWEKVKHLQSDCLNHMQIKEKFKGKL